MTKLAAILLIFTVLGCKSTGKEKSNKKLTKEGTPKFEFQEEFHNFGSLQAGEVVAYNFQFKNSGDGILTIQKIDSDCGCLVVNFPKEEIAPGKSDYIEVIFNSAGETGNVLKEFEIYANIPAGTINLAIAATVKNEIINLYSKN